MTRRANRDNIKADATMPLPHVTIADRWRGESRRDFTMSKDSLLATMTKTNTTAGCNLNEVGCQHPADSPPPGMGLLPSFGLD